MNSTFRSSLLLIAIELGIAITPQLANATLPSVRFGDMARMAGCIAVARPVGKITADEYEFETLAMVAGTDCAAGRFTVKRSTTEALASFGPVPYLLFLNRLGADQFAYAGEPFGAISITDGVASTFAFVELPAKMPIERVIELAHTERKAIGAGMPKH